MERPFLSIIMILLFYIAEFRTVFSQSSFTCSNPDKKNSTNYLVELKKCLFTGYDPKAVPLQVNEKSITVDLEITLEDIFFEDSTAEATVYILLAMNWTDPFLKWNPNDYGNISKIILTGAEAATKVWTPMFSHAYTFRFGSRKDTDDLFSVFRLEVTSEGKVSYDDYINLNSMCNGDLENFPFDVYNCASVIVSDDFHNKVVFRIKNELKNYDNETASLDMSLYTKKHFEIDPSSAFVYIDISKRPIEDLDQMIVTAIYLTFNMNRKSGTHIIVFHLPAKGFLMLLLLPLWISPESLLRYVYPLIVTFGSMFQVDAIVTLLRIPASHYKSSIHIISFYQDLMLLSLVILIESMMVALIWTNKPLPDWLLGVYHKLSNVPYLKSLFSFTLFEDKSSKETIEPPDYSSSSGKPTMNSFAKIVDRLLFLGLLLIEGVMYWNLVPQPS